MKEICCNVLEIIVVICGAIYALLCVPFAICKVMYVMSRYENPGEGDYSLWFTKLHETHPVFMILLTVCLFYLLFCLIKYGMKTRAFQ